MTDQLSNKEIKALEKVIDKSLKDTSFSLNIEKAYKVILEQNPPSQIVKYHKFGKFDYLPITAVERLLDGLFAGWTVEILREAQVVNGFYVVVRVTAHIPQSDKVLVADGIGFAELQTASGASPTDFTKLMQSAGVLAIPKAKAEAVKNAVKTFGNLFGRNLARNDDNASLEGDVVSASRVKIGNALKPKNENQES